MKYCISCGSPLEEHKGFCFKCGTPVEIDGVFYEEDTYPAKSFFRNIKRHASEEEKVFHHNNKRKWSGLRAGIFTICILIIGATLFQTGVLSNSIGEMKNYFTRNERLENEESKTTIKIAEEDAEIAFTLKGDKVDIDEEIMIQEATYKAKWKQLIENIKKLMQY